MYLARAGIAADGADGIMAVILAAQGGLEIGAIAEIAAHRVRIGLKVGGGKRGAIGGHQEQQRYARERADIGQLADGGVDISGDIWRIYGGEDAGILRRNRGKGAKARHFSFHRAGCQDKELILLGIQRRGAGPRGEMIDQHGGVKREGDRCKQGTRAGHGVPSRRSAIWAAMGIAEVAAGEGALQTCRLWAVSTNKKSSMILPSGATA